MKHSRYLNLMLTVNALLLALLLWGQWTGGNPLLQSADAAGRQPGVGIPNAGAQRQELIELTRRLNENVEDLSRAVAAGQAKVHVTNLDEIDRGSRR